MMFVFFVWFIFKFSKILQILVFVMHLKLSPTTTIKQNINKIEYLENAYIPLSNECNSILLNIW